MTTEDPDASAEPGRLLAGRYRMSHLLGAGGMGRVWEGDDELLDRPVAIKELMVAEHVPQNEVDILRTRMLREARSAAQLSHPAIITVFDVVEEDDRPWIVMELVRGPSLSEVLKNGETLDPVRVARIGAQMAAGLSLAHERGIVHRDIKPGNVLMAPDDRSVLTDFGIARLEGTSSLTSTGLLLGSPSYLAPEQARGEMAGPSTDIWALGVTLYQAVEGNPPFSRTSPMATLTAIVTEDVPVPESAGPLQPLLMWMLDKNPDRRPDIPAVRAELEQILVTAGGNGTENGGGGGREERTKVIPVPPPPPEVAAPTSPEAAPTSPAPEAVPVAHEAHGGPPVPPPSTPPPPATPAGSGGGRSGGPDRRTPLLALLAVAAIVLVVAGIVWVTYDPRDSPADNVGAGGAEPSEQKSSEAPKSPDATKKEEGSGSGGEGNGGGDEDEPAGLTEFNGSPLRNYDDESGFSLDVPENWEVERRDSSVFFRNPEGGYLQVDQTDSPGDDAEEDWEQQSGGAAGNFGGYQEVGIDDYEGDALDEYETAADWEFTFDGNNGRMHAINRGFQNEEKGYALFLVAPEKGFSKSRDLLDHMTETFKGQGAE